MSKLPKLQKDFLDGIFTSSDKIHKALKKHAHISPEQQMQIYSNNTFLILTENLKKTFPATTALGSDAFFDYLANNFIKAHPPTSGDMNDYGKEFPDFMRKSELVKDHPFLSDVAKMEWLRQESYMAAEPVFEDAELPFIIHPSLRLFTSPWPVLNLWKVAKGQMEADEINMDADETYTIIFHQGVGIEMWQVNKPSFSFLKALQNDSTFDPPDDFNVEAHIVQMMKAKIIIQNPNGAF